MTIAQLHAFIQSHGFNSWTYNGLIEISVPATDRAGRKVEMVVQSQPTLKAVKEALGY